MLTDAQLPALRAAIDAATDPAFVADRAIGNTGLMADWFNKAGSFYVWRTNVSEEEITSKTSAEATVWSWPAFIARSEAERFGWARMFNGRYAVNPILPQVRQGFADIFSGAANSAPAQRAHLNAICKRLATRGEALYATGTGTLVTPGFLVFEGAIGDYDIVRAINL